MNRVNGMPIRVKCNYTIDDSRWIGEKIVQGQEIDIYGQDGLDWILAEHPDCVYEIEMTQEDFQEYLKSNPPKKWEIKDGRFVVDKVLEDGTIEGKFTLNKNIPNVLKEMNRKGIRSVDYMFKKNK